MYVAISRITNISNLFLIGEYSANAFRVNIDATTEYNRLRQYNTFLPCNNITVDKHSLTVSLLNTRSLKKHATDIAKESRLMESDVICLTETQISMGEDTFNIEQTLNNFNVYFNTSEQRFLNLAICLRSSIELVTHSKMLGVSMVNVLKPSFSINILKLVLLYRSPNSSIPLFFYENLREIVNPELHVDIILSNFNLNIFNATNDTLGTILSNYQLIINDATHISGSLIDHVFISKTLL